MRVNGNVDEGTITRDLEGMKRNGIGGLLMFDAAITRITRDATEQDGLHESGGPWDRKLASFAEADQLVFLGRNDMPQGEFWFTGGPTSWACPRRAARRSYFFWLLNWRTNSAVRSRYVYPCSKVASMWLNSASSLKVEMCNQSGLDFIAASKVPR